MPDASADPFGERRGRALRAVRWLLGTRCVFEAGDRDLMRIVDAACGGLPAQRSANAPTCRIELRRKRGGRRFGRAGPPRVVAGAAAGMLTGIIDADNHMVVAPSARAAAVVMSDTLLAHPYHARYELLEFALLSLLTRVRELVPLHAACVGRAGKGLLLLGDSGAGKSTLCFHAATAGLRMLAEDSVFIEPRSLVAGALPAFVHLRRDAPGLLDAAQARTVRAAPQIRRRSGELKFEVDLRHLAGARLAGPLRIAAVVRLTARTRRPALRAMAARSVAALLVREQPYAATQPGWDAFLARVTRLPAFELARGTQPRDAVAALEILLRECAP
ncbi:MAG TPA: hypothetical protein VK624_01015 [Steroidobacteraceae bacterium]|nr:hypothetical protein [Steroidobacteraceae bacterium]